MTWNEIEHIEYRQNSKNNKDIVEKNKIQNGWLNGKKHENENSEYL